MKNYAKSSFLIGKSKDPASSWKIKKHCFEGLSDFFEILVLASECDRVKPFPDPYLKALQELDISHKHAFVLEDSVSGIKAGMGAGMPVVGLGTRNPAQLLIEAGAVFVIADFDDPKLWTELEEMEIKAEATTTTK
ncbi:hypothetical protein D5086_025611 [Populus alba]|uniref:Uncharacterized protein n=1 Tax=Populus alba TaxID=43335 RepID=A0ACC4AZL3_POPAL